MKGQGEESVCENRTGEAPSRDQNNFLHKYTRVSLIITGKSPT